MRSIREYDLWGQPGQQIHSLRANGVISAQTPFAAESDAIASPKSAGMRCVVPEAAVRFSIA